MKNLNLIEKANIIQKIIEVQKLVSENMEHCISINKDYVQMTEKQFDYFFSDCGFCGSRNHSGVKEKFLKIANIEFLALTDEPYND